MPEINKNELRATLLSSEYKEVRTEVRTMLILETISIFLSIFVFIILFTISVFTKEYIFLFISPALSLLLIILAMGMFSYTVSLGLRASEVEGELKKILGVATIQWESTVGIFGVLTQQSDIFSAKIGKEWKIIAILAIIVSSALIVLLLSHYFSLFYSEWELWAYPAIGIDILAAAVTVYFGVTLLFKQAWQTVG